MKHFNVFHCDALTAQDSVVPQPPEPRACIVKALKRSIAELWTGDLVRHLQRSRQIDGAVCRKNIVLSQPELMLQENPHFQ